MTFAQPHWLLVGLLCCIGLLLLFRLLQKRRRAVLERFAARQLIGRLTSNISEGKRRYKNILLLLAVFMCFAALARPQYGFKWVDVKRKGIDLLFALDTSKSMLAEDIKPNRLKRAHLAILDFVQQLEGDRVGLMPFAGSTYLMCPLTLDYEAFEDSLSAVTTDIIPRGGTNIARVIEKAVTTLNNAANHKILIILTDGENLEGDAVRAAADAAEKGLTIYTVGVGTSQGELIPLSAGGGKGFVKDQKGNFVTSKLDETALSAIAEKSGALYVPLGSAGEGLESIYQQKLALIPKEELAERRHKIPLERFEWPLAAAMFFLGLELLIGERKKVRALPFYKKIAQVIRRGQKMVGVSSITLLLCCNFAERAYSSKGEEAFLQGDYLQASEYYQQRLTDSPNDPKIQYNFGTAAYKNNMFDDAIEAFTKALKSDDVGLQAMAYYNRGNSHFQKGLESQQGDPKTTIKEWQQALESMQAALELAPDDADAMHNQEVIKKKLEELENQQQQEQQNQQKQEEQQDGQDGQEQQQDQKQSGDGQNQQQNDNPEQEQQQNQAESARQQEGENKPREQPSKQNDQQNEGNDPKPEAVNPMQQQEKDQGQQQNQDAMRQRLGKMTKEEAERLLNGLKNEEGELNFVPSGQENLDRNIDKDW